MSCTKPISLNGAAYRGIKNRGTTHIKDIVKLPDGSFALVSKQLCIDAGIAYGSFYLSENKEVRFEKAENKIRDEPANISSSNIISNSDINKEQKATKLCTKCGFETSLNSKFCEECGAKIDIISSSSSLNLSDNMIQRSQIGAASVGNININIHQKDTMHDINNVSSNHRAKSYIFYGLILISVLILVIYLIR